MASTEETVFQQKLLEKAYFVIKRTGRAMVRPASSDKCFFITVIPTRSICYSATTRTGHLEEDNPVTRFMKTKDSQVFFLQTDQFKVDRLQIIVVAKKYIYVCVQFHNWFIHEFEGCFLRGQVSSNGFKVFNPVFNSCIVEP